MGKNGRMSGFFGYVFDHGTAPKNESIEEHRKHCRAEPGNCPFEKKIVEKAGEEDTVAKPNGGQGQEPAAQGNPKAELKATAKALEGLFKGVAKQIVGEENLDPDIFSVTPTMTWSPVTGTETPTGGFRLSFMATKNGEKCEDLLNALANDYGVSRKPKDMYPSGDGSCRVGTFLTGEEAKTALAKFEDIKKQVAEKAKADAAAAEVKAKAEAQGKTVAMATAVVTEAAKSVNHHIDQGDFAPNKSKIDAALNAKGDLQDLLDGKMGSVDEKAGAQAKILLSALGEIESSYYKGEHNKVQTIPEFGEKPKPKDPPPNNGKGGPDNGKKYFDPKTFKGEAEMVKENHNALLAAAKTINFHLSQGDTDYNPGKISAYKKVGTFYDKMFMETENGTPEHDYAEKMLAVDGAIKMAIAAQAGGIEAVKKNLKDGTVGTVPALPDMGGSGSGKDSSLPPPYLKITGGKPPKKDGAAPDLSDLKGEEYATDASVWGEDYDFTGNAPESLKSAADAMSVADAEKTLKDPNGPLQGLVGQIISSPNQLSGVTKNVAKGHHGLDDQQMFEDSVKMAAVMFTDLKARFPNIPLPKVSYLFPSKPNNPLVGAEFTRAPDGSTAICYHADYKDVSHAGNYSYGHKDSRYPFDVLRHELGHAIGKGEIHQQWKKFLGDTYGFPATGFFKVMKAKVSKYAAACKPGVKTPDIYESLAETFSMVTSHDYKAGTLPLPIENFIYTKMLGCPDPKKS